MKKIFRKIAIVLLVYLAVTSIAGPVYSAFAADGFKALEANGKCADGTVKVTGAPVSAPCLAQSGDLTLCTGTTDIYHLADNADMCPAAAGSDAGESLTAQQTIEKFLALIITVEKLLNKLLWPILFLIGDLLKSDILFGAGMEDRLYNIWVPIRNLVNILFVLGLVGLALYSVLGISGEQSNYSIKTMLPKLIAGIIAVNFSFIVIKVFLDVVNVFTTSIFAIPTQIEAVKDATPGSKDDQRSKAREAAFCEQVYSIKEHSSMGASIEATALQQTAQKFDIFLTDTKQIKAVASKFSTTKATEWGDEMEKLKKLSLCASVDTGGYGLNENGKKFFKQYGSNNAALAMAVNMGEVIFYNKVSQGAMGSNKYESLAVNAIFSLLLYLVYVVSFVVLFIVLLARLVVLWLGIAISPVMALILTVPIAKEKLSSVEPLIGKFISHAIAPIPIALSMTVGWIMLNAVKSTMVETSAVATGALIPSIPIPGLETLQGLMISLATVAVVWVGVFTAANETIAGGMTKVVQGKLQDFGQFIATAPIKYTPWVPVEVQEGSEPERLSISGISQALGSVRNRLETKAADKAGKAFGFDVDKGLNAINGRTDPDEVAKILGGKSLKDFKSKETYEKMHSLKRSELHTNLKRIDEPWAKKLAEAIESKDHEDWEKKAGTLSPLLTKKKREVEKEEKKSPAKKAEEAKAEEKALEEREDYKRVATAIKTETEGKEEKVVKKLEKEVHTAIENAATKEPAEEFNMPSFNAELARTKNTLEPLKVKPGVAKKLITDRIEEVYKGADKKEEREKKLAAVNAWFEKPESWPETPSTPPPAANT